MKTVRVVAAVIKKENKIFATARGYGEFKGLWEFPGGKIEPGETPQEALAREIKEELDTEISVGQLIDTVEYDYPSFHLSMDCFWCEIIKGDLILKEAQEAKWLAKDELGCVQWLPADLELLEIIKSGLIMKLEDILQNKKSCIKDLNYGNANTIEEFWNSVIKDNLPKKDIAIKIYKMLLQYVNDKDAVFVVRNFSSPIGGKRNYQTLRRGFLTKAPNTSFFHG